jgi:hypothetical protein
MLKETGGYYRRLDNRIEWHCNEISCETANISKPVSYVNGNHILTCPVCKTKRRVIVVGILDSNGKLIH